MAGCASLTHAHVPRNVPFFTRKPLLRRQNIRSRQEPRNSRSIPPRVQTVCAVGPKPGVGGGGGSGVLERTVPGRQSEFDLGKQRKTKKPPNYRVLLHNDEFNKREYVVQVLLKVIPGMSVDIAVNVMQQAHMHGKACVITAPQEDAEDYCEGLRSNGLVSSVEPDGKE
mmetsp:Transcript_21100/g.40172  ORF Transcript_21100/g.40172 Transcript_21100/m.40172 type:complete len:169 (+) Transcript_21100:67-573(+)|eukprot:CAMPEP_0114256708 /NCGR_PEP_ID=MMETSP0058-20121206/18317_1 /TAXON_ID=36894 /ORGANISM="Pyramimonas parkeae, CCMP726" /LENGTH=168 /DNA_ID=CAMNT_0001371333 /DNA_START=55 /DNA_END=561 /DNA_ORIENTATION=+